MTRVLLEGVTKVYADAVEALAGVNLEIPSGELLALVGPSGCGKTTLLRLIAGLENPSAGTMRFDDKRMNDTPPHRRNTAMVFQDEALQPHLSVRENLAFGLKLRRRWWRSKIESNQESNPQNLTNEEINNRIEQAAAAVGIAHLLDRLPRQLSGGERQRTALGQAMVRKPSVLLLDEPLSHLDARLRGELRAEIKQLQRRLDVTTIYVTHDQDEALALGDRIAVMSSGRLHQVGPPLDVYDHPLSKTVAEMLGNPPMNVIAGTLQQNSDGNSAGVCFVGGGLRVELSPRQAAALGGNIGQPVEMGVRPEHVRIRDAKTPAGETPLNVDSLANITMVETLGDSTILHLRLKSEAESRPITCKQSGRWTEKPDGGVILAINSEDCHFFDSNSGETVA